jgi:hypothetical protein
MTKSPVSNSNKKGKGGQNESKFQSKNKDEDVKKRLGEIGEIYSLLTFGFQITTCRFFISTYTHHFVTSLNVTPKFPVFFLLYILELA